MDHPFSAVGGVVVLMPDFSGAPFPAVAPRDAYNRRDSGT
jgi:hypothetical protein